MEVQGSAMAHGLVPLTLGVLIAPQEKIDSEDDSDYEKLDHYTRE
jgi:hypothetical protein